jgi:hypothetical protein
MDLFDVTFGVAITMLVVMGIVFSISIVYFIRSAPPTSITITSGPEGSIFQKNALKYAKILEANGVKVKVLTSEGSIQNLDRLLDPKSNVEVGMVQGGISVPGKEDSKLDHLISLGGISHQPILIFYRGKEMIYLSELKKHKVAIGPIGSGTNQLALTLLALNGIKPNEDTPLLNMEPHDAANALKNHQIEAAFVMSESASTEILKTLLHEKDVRLYSFKQVKAYSRKVSYLDILSLPQGGIDIGTDIPPKDVDLLGPMVELVAVKDLHPALSDLLLEAATQVHGQPGMFQQRGEFPAAVEHSIHLSDDASRYYKSGKSLLYRYLPFWLASLVSRVLVVFLPALVLLIPIMKAIPAFFRWRVQSKIYRHYRDLLTLERRFVAETDPAKQDQLQRSFDRIEESVNRMKVKSKYADQVYGLRGHIDYVRRLVEKKHSPSTH